MRYGRVEGRRNASSAVPRISWTVRVREASAPLRVRPYRLHFFARMLSWTGSSVSTIGLAFAVLHIQGGAGALGLVLAAGMLPQILLLLVGGVVADRWSRAKVMLWANVVSFAAEGAAAVLLWAGAAKVWHLAAMAAVCGAASAFFTPAAGGVVVEVVPAEMRHAANALLKLGQNTVKVGGPAIGGVLVALVGPAWVIGWDALTFAAAAVLCSRIGLKTARVKVKSGFVADLRDGWTDFWSRRWLWVMVMQGAVIVPAWLVGYQALGPVYGERFLGGPGLWGVVVSGFTGGLIAGAAAALMWRPRLAAVVVCAGTGTMALPLAAMALRMPVPVLVVTAFTAGAGLAFSGTTWASVVQARIPADRMSRTMSYSTLGQLIPVPVGYVLVGPLVTLLGLRVTLVAGALLIGCAAIAPLALAQVRELSATELEEAAETALASATRAPR